MCGASTAPNSISARHITSGGNYTRQLDPHLSKGGKLTVIGTPVNGYAGEDYACVHIFCVG